jgi:thiol-disulfide isomerase/thioredoxin
LRQAPDGRLTGTFILPEVGDLRYLLGRVVGSHAELSVFDGIHGFHIAMDAKSGGQKLEGRWLVSGIGAFPFTATRAKPPETHVANSARLAPGKTRISLPELDAAPYRGNPVIVDYFGTWCPVCIDLTPHLVRLQRKYAASGLQVLSIALEPESDQPATKRRLDEFRAEFGMTWPFTVRYSDDFFAAVPPELLDATGFPITIFIRRDGTVAKIHTGFISKAAPDEHAAAVKLLEDYTAEIVASPAPVH